MAKTHVDWLFFSGIGMVLYLILSVWTNHYWVNMKLAWIQTVPNNLPFWIQPIHLNKTYFTRLKIWLSLGDVLKLVYSRISITRTFKGNRKRFKISGVRAIASKISKKMTWRGIEKDRVSGSSSYWGFELSGFNCIVSYPWKSKANKICIFSGFIEVGGYNGLWEKYGDSMGQPWTTTHAAMTTMAPNGTNFTTAATTLASTVASNMSTVMPTNGSDLTACYKLTKYWGNMFRPIDDPDYPWLGLWTTLPIMGVWYWCTDQVHLSHNNESLCHTIMCHSLSDNHVSLSVTQSCCGV